MEVGERRAAPLAGRVVAAGRGWPALGVGEGHGAVVEAAGAAGAEATDAAVDRNARSEREDFRMRIAITATGPELTSLIDQRFGRAKYLLVVDIPERTVSAVSNHAGMNAAQGAGIQAAQSVVDNKATALITGHCGPKAFRALKAAGIDVYLAPGGTVNEAIDRFEAGQLTPAPAADVDGHW